jgi:hypothetical protein
VELRSAQHRKQRLDLRQRQVLEPFCRLMSRTPLRARSAIVRISFGLPCVTIRPCVRLAIQISRCARGFSYSA